VSSVSTDVAWYGKVARVGLYSRRHAASELETKTILLNQQTTALHSEKGKACNVYWQVSPSLNPLSKKEHAAAKCLKSQDIQRLPLSLSCPLSRPFKPKAYISKYALRVPLSARRLSSPNLCRTVRSGRLRISSYPQYYALSASDRARATSDRPSVP